MTMLWWMSLLCALWKITKPLFTTHGVLNRGIGIYTPLECPQPSTKSDAKHKHMLGATEILQQHLQQGKSGEKRIRISYSGLHLSCSCEWNMQRKRRAQAKIDPSVFILSDTETSGRARKDGRLGWSFRDLFKNRKRELSHAAWGSPDQ